jgi:hypothetical protein
MRYALIALSILLGTATPAMAQVSVGISIPGVSIGINQPAYPELVPVPGYPVYYAPQAQANYFFYDGLYWVYQDDRWYASSWYDGPWDYVEPDNVPLFVLRVPVRYYVHPPVYFRGWVVTAPPRWDVYWGPRWAQHRHGWDHWDRRVVYAPAPLPVYQRQYVGDRYPRAEQQRAVRDQHYRYQPRDAVARQHYQERPAPRPQAHAQPVPQNRADSSREQRPQREREETRRSEPKQVLPSQRAPAAQEQRPQPERQVQPAPQSRPAPQHSPDSPRAQSAPREREAARKPEGMQVLPQQQQQARQQQQQRREQAPRAQQAPRPQQAQDRGPQDRGDRQPRGNPERGGDRGNDKR